MKKFSGKYEQICEETLYRYQQSGFLCGDYVRIKKDALKHPMVESMSDQVRDIIKSAIKNETVLRISYIKSSNSEAPNGPIGAPNVPGCIWADIIFEYAPGMWKDPMTLPLAIVQKVVKESDAEGYIPYNDELIRPNDNSNKGASKDSQTKVTDTNRNLTTKNVKLANTKKPKDGRDSTKLTENIMAKDVLGKLRENDMIFESYIKHLQNEGLMSKAGDVVGAGAQKIGTAINKLGTKMRGPEAKNEIDEIRAIAKNPEQLADKLSEIKRLKGVDALTNILQQMMTSGLQDELLGAVQHVKNNPSKRLDGRTIEGETPPSNASMVDGEDGSSVPTHSEKPSSTEDYMA